MYFWIQIDACRWYAYDGWWWSQWEIWHMHGDEFEGTVFDLQVPDKQWWEIEWTPESVNLMDPNLVVHVEDYDEWQNPDVRTPPCIQTPSAWSDSSGMPPMRQEWTAEHARDQELNQARWPHVHDRRTLNLVDCLDLPERPEYSPLNPDGSMNVHAHPQHGDPACLISTTTEHDPARRRRWGEPMRFFTLPLDATFGGEWSSDGEDYPHVRYSYTETATIPGEANV